MRLNKKLSGFLIVLAILVLAYSVYAVILTAANFERSSPTIPYLNISSNQSGGNLGQRFNLSIQLTAYGNGAGADNITNVTFEFRSVFNNTVILNITVSNNSNYTGAGLNNASNQTYFNVTLNTSSMGGVSILGGVSYSLFGSQSIWNMTSAVNTTFLRDGIYNLTIIVVQVGAAETVIQNSSLIGIVVDNTPPVVSGLSIANQTTLLGQNKTATGGTTSINFSMNVTVYDALSGVANVTFSFEMSNGTVVNYSAFNLTPWGNSSMQNNVSGGANCTCTGNDAGANNSALNMIRNGTIVFGALVNLTELTEGTHTLRVVAVDYANNRHEQVASSFKIDRTGPITTLSLKEATDTSLKVTITTEADATTCTSNRGVVTGSGSGQEISATGLDAATSYTFEVTCTDAAANYRTVKETFETVSSAGSGGTGGGSGGGSSSGVVDQFETKLWTSILEGETASVAVRGDELGVTEVSFAVAKATYGPLLKVEKVSTLPQDKQFSRKMYSSVKITEVNVQKVLKDTAKVSFKVANSWLSDNKMGKNNVALFRFVDDKWTELTTTVGADDGTFTYFTAETPGFSYFVIGEKEEVAPAPEEAEAPAQPTPEVEGEEAAEAGAVAGKPGRANVVAWAVAAVVVLGVVVWWYLSRRKK